jgi:uncharacterized membrane protein
MDRELLIVVPSQRAAEEAVRALQRLDAEGAIELFAARILTRDQSGHVSVHTAASGSERAGIAGALAVPVGALIGLIEAPLVTASAVTAGIAAGAATGLVTAAAYYGIAGDFLHAVSTHFRPGNWAVSASLWEDGTRRVDEAVAPCHVFRQTTPPMVQTQLRSELEDLERAEGELDREIEQAGDDGTKAALAAERDAVRDERAAVREVMRTRKAQLEQGWSPAVRARHEAHLRRMSRVLEEQDAAVERFLG